MRPEALGVAVGQPAGTRLVIEHHVLVRGRLVRHEHLPLADVALLVALHHRQHVVLLLLVARLRVTGVDLHLWLLMVVALAVLVLHRVSAILCSLG